MKSQLKKRLRSDTQVNEPRRAPHSWDRIVYLLLLTGFFLGVANYLFGDRVFLRADGLVLRDRHSIESTYIVRVTDIMVKPGQRVDVGDRVFRAESTAILDQLAELSVRNAEIDERLAALRNRKHVVEQMLPVVERRAQELAETRHRIGSASLARLVTSARTESIQDQVLTVESELQRLTALDSGLTKEIEAVSVAREHAQSGITRLSKHYDDGFRFTPVTGVVDYSVPSDGEVFNPGEPIMSVLSGDPYVLTYLPRKYLFSLEVGDTVRIHYGKTSAIGLIDAILPVSQSVPDEFHNAFRARERRQLARISLPPDFDVPASATVRVTR